MAKLQAACSLGQLRRGTDRQTDKQTDGSQYRLMPPLQRGLNKDDISTFSATQKREITKKKPQHNEK